MKRLGPFLAAWCLMLGLCPATAQADPGDTASIITATGADVPTDDHLPEEYRFPSQYRDQAVQFQTSDGVLLAGYVLGAGSKGITLGHPNGWMVKSWLPFAERLVDADYMVILWEFRNIPPSGRAPDQASRRWDLDVLAAAQVLRERGATQILAMGASDGGTATVLAAPDIPELAGLGILSSPKDSIGDAVSAMGRIKDVPAFFAVSTRDSSGDFYPHVEALYHACPSTNKQFNVIDGYDHGTDMITPIVPGLGYASQPTNEAQVQQRQELSDKLLQFVTAVLGSGSGGSTASPSDTAPPSTPATSPNSTISQLATPSRTPTNPNPSSSPATNDQTGSSFPLLPVTIGGVIALIAVAAVLLLRAKRRRTP